MNMYYTINNSNRTSSINTLDRIVLAGVFSFFVVVGTYGAYDMTANAPERQAAIAKKQHNINKLLRIAKGEDGKFSIEEKQQLAKYFGISYSIGQSDGMQLYQKAGKYYLSINNPSKGSTEFEIQDKTIDNYLSSFKGELPKLPKRD